MLLNITHFKLKSYILTINNNTCCAYLLHLQPANDLTKKMFSKLILIFLAKPVFNPSYGKSTRLSINFRIEHTFQ